MTDKKFVCVDANVLCSPLLNVYEKLVFLMLHALADNENTCTASAGYIARQCNISSRQVHRCIRKLEDEGLVEIVARKGVDGGTLPNTYMLRK